MKIIDFVTETLDKVVEDFWADREENINRMQSVVDKGETDGMIDVVNAMGQDVRLEYDADTGMWYDPNGEHFASDELPSLLHLINGNLVFDY